MKRKQGYFDKYGGIFIPETLMPAVEELEKAFARYKNEKKFNKEFTKLLEDYAGRPTSLTLCSKK